MRHLTVNINSVADLLNELPKQLNTFIGPIWFRGQGVFDWNLEPRLLRMTDGLPETHYLNRFKQNATFILPPHQKTEFEWMFLMQHYGIPTRLLDWSESPLVALYFAVENPLLIDQDSALWVLLPTELNKLSRYEPVYEFEIPSFEDDHLRNYQPSVISAELKTRLLPVAAIAPRNSSRMQSQQGVFTITHRANYKIDEIAGFDFIWKYRIPASAKKPLLEELRLLGINKFQLFPELESLSHNL